jgi:hypothetical protein
MVMDFFLQDCGRHLGSIYICAETNRKCQGKPEGRRAGPPRMLLRLLQWYFPHYFFCFSVAYIIAAAAINSSSDSAWLGFAIVAGFYLALTIGIYVWKNANKKKNAEEYERDNKTTVTT